MPPSPAAPAPARLEASGIGLWRGERLVLRGVDLAVAPGCALLLTGPNGAGKSSLLRLLAGLVRPSSGSLRWDGADLALEPAVHAAYLGHADGLKPALTVLEQLRSARAIAGAPLNAADAHAALATLGLDPLAGLPVRLLSAGQRRRLALCCRLVPARPLWLLDEPGNGLDRASAALLEDLLLAHLDRGGSVVAATHTPLLAALAPERRAVLELHPPRLDIAA